MERFKIITYREKAILRVDLTHCNTHRKEELKQVIGQIKAEIATHPPGSVLILTDVSGMRFDLDILKLFIDYTKHNQPYIKASAVSGIAGLLQFAVYFVSGNASRSFLTLGNEVKAMDWLVTRNLLIR